MLRAPTDPSLVELKRQAATAFRARLRGDAKTDAYAHHVINAILDRMGY